MKFASILNGFVLGTTLIFSMAAHAGGLAARSFSLTPDCDSPWSLSLDGRCDFTVEQSHWASAAGDFLSRILDRKSGAMPDLTEDLAAASLAATLGMSDMFTSQSGVTRAELIAKLWHTRFAHDPEAAAFSTAIWEISLEKPLKTPGVNTGAVAERGGSDAVAQPWVDSLTGSGAQSSLSAATKDSDETPDRIHGAPIAVPLPPAAVAGAALMGVMILLRSWKKRGGW